MPTQPQLHDPPPRPRILLHALGLGLLLANKVRRNFRPYDRPRPWSARDLDRSVAYAFDVVRNWESGFRDAGIGDWIRGRHVLELGPGPDLGTGLILLARGAASYIAVDRFPLATAASESFYDRLFDRLAGESEAWRAVEAYQQYRSDPSKGALRYVLFEEERISLPSGVEPRDLWVSQAAFEHVRDPAVLIGELTDHCSEGALALHHVDAATHTPWIREADPLNILRYSDRLYGALEFPGSPNRWRAERYISAFRRSGWDLIENQPIHRLSPRATEIVRPGLSGSFRSLSNHDLAVFSFRLVLRRGGLSGSGNQM